MVFTDRANTGVSPESVEGEHAVEVGFPRIFLADAGARASYVVSGRMVVFLVEETRESSGRLRTRPRGSKPANREKMVSTGNGILLAFADVESKCER